MVAVTECEGGAVALLVPVSDREPDHAADAEKMLLKVPSFSDLDALKDLDVQPEALDEPLLVTLCIETLELAVEVGLALAAGEGVTEVEELALGEGEVVRDRSAVAVAAALCDTQ